MFLKFFRNYHSPDHRSTGLYHTCVCGRPGDMYLCSFTLTLYIRRLDVCV